MNTRDIPLIISWFETAVPTGRALGDPEHTTWGAFAEVFAYRREGPKDGPGFATARFRLETDGRRVRRKKDNLLARTAIALDIETSKLTGEVPPPPHEVIARIKAHGYAGLLYTSHNHQESDARYRIVFPLSAEIAIEIPAPEIMAERLGLAGVLDTSKIGAASFFYLPSCPEDLLEHHHTELVDGKPIDAAWITGVGNKILEAERIEKERVANEAQAAAAGRMAAKIAAGFDPEDSIIEKIRSHLDLDNILLSHGYEKSGANGKSGPNYKHPNSTSGCFGASIKVLGGIERVFSHNATDPLHADNLPEWCGKVSAVDAFDVTAILDFGGDRKKALRTLAERFGLAKVAEKKALAALLFRLIKCNASAPAIKAAGYAEGETLGLSREEVCRVAVWVASQATREAA